MSKEKILTIAVSIAAVGTIAYFTVLSPSEEVDTSTQNQNVNLEEIVAEEEVNRGSDYVLVYDPVAKEYKKLKLSVLTFKDEEKADTGGDEGEEPEGENTDSPTPVVPNNIGDVVTPEELSTSDLTDVAGTSPSEGQVLVWDAGANQWKPATLNIPTGETIDEQAVHVDEAGEIAALTEKGTPAGTDFILIEDSEDNNAKKKIQIGNLPTGSSVNDIDDLGDVDTTTSSPTDGQVLVWDLVNSEWVPGDLPASGATSANELSDVDTVTIPPTAGQVLVWDDGASEWVPGDLPSAGASAIDDLSDVDTSSVSPTDGQSLVWNNSTGEWEPQTIISDTGIDTDALHQSTAAEVSSLSEKITPVDGDVLLIEDSADSYNKKKLQISNLKTEILSNVAIDNLSDVDTSSSAPTDGQSLVWNDSNSAWEPATITSDTGVDTSAIHDNVSGEISVITEKATPVSGDFILIEDSEASNAKKRIQVGSLPTGATTADELSDVDTSSVAPTDGQALVWDNSGSKWVPGDLPSGGFENPMTSPDDLIVGLQSDEDNFATVPNGATVSSYGEWAGNLDDYAIDENDGTAWQASDNDVIGSWIIVDLGTARNIYQVHILQSFSTSNQNAASHHWTLEYSEDGAGWTQIVDRDYGGHPASMDDVVDFTPTFARYWRMTNVAVIPENWGWALRTLDLIGTAGVGDPGTPVRLAVGTGGQVLKVNPDDGHIAWLDNDIDGLSDVDTSSVAPTDGQSLVWNDANSAWEPATITSDTGVDTSAIHDNVSGEISVITEKATPVAGDYILIEDSEDSNAKKALQIGNLPTGATTINELTDVDTATVAPTAGQGLVWDDESGKWITGDFATVNHTHTDVAGYDVLGTPAEGNVLMYTETGVNITGSETTASHTVGGTGSAGAITYTWELYKPIQLNELWMYQRDDNKNMVATIKDSEGTTIATYTGNAGGNRNVFWQLSAAPAGPHILQAGIYTIDCDFTNSNYVNTVSNNWLTVSGVFQLRYSTNGSNSFYPMRFVYQEGEPVSALEYNDPSSIISQGIDNLTDVDTSSVAPTDGQSLVWNDANSAWEPATITSDTGVDTSAIHDNVSGEISVLTEKATPVSGDYILIEDSEASNAKKRIQVGSLPTGATSADELSDVDTSSVAPTDGQVLVWDNSNSKWEPGDLPSTGATSLDELSDVDVSSSVPTYKQSLLWDPDVGKFVPGNVPYFTGVPSENQVLQWGASGLGENKNAGTNSYSYYSGVNQRDIPIYVKRGMWINSFTSYGFSHRGYIWQLKDYDTGTVLASTNGGAYEAGNQPHTFSLNSPFYVDPGYYKLMMLVNGSTDEWILQGAPFDYEDMIIGTDGNDIYAPVIVNYYLHDYGTGSWVDNDIDGLTDVDTSTVAPTDGQSLVWNDANSAWEPATIVSDTGVDTTAIHDNVSGEISLITEKATPVNTDLLVIEDSADSNIKKRIQIGSLPFASAIGELSDVDTTSVAPTAGQALVWDDVNSKWVPGDVSSISSTSIGARVYNSSSITITSNSWTTLAFDTEHYDTGNFHNTTSNTERLSITESGQYLISASLQWAGNATSFRTVEIFYNSTTPIASDTVHPTDTATSRQTLSTIYSMNPGDYLEVRVIQSSGVSIDILTASNMSPEFSIQRISGGASVIDELTDVDTSSLAPTDGQTLVWNAEDSQWKPGGNHYPSRASMWHHEATPISGGAMYMTNDSNMLFNIRSHLESPADGNTFTHSFYIEGGTYNLSILGETGPYCGIIDWYIDDVLVVSGQDWYTGSQTRNVTKTATVNIVGSGRHVIKGVINGKNASANDYYFVGVKYWLSPAIDTESHF